MTIRSELMRMWVVLSIWTHYVELFMSKEYAHGAATTVKDHEFRYVDFLKFFSIIVLMSTKSGNIRGQGCITILHM